MASLGLCSASLCVSLERVVCFNGRCGLHYAGVFHTRHEDGQSGRVWEGIIKYHIGAILDQPDVSPDKRLSVRNHQSHHPSFIINMCV